MSTLLPTSSWLTLVVRRLYTLFKRLVTQAEALRKAATTGEIDDADVKLIGICSDFSAAGDSLQAAQRIWNDLKARSGGGVKAEHGSSAKGKNQIDENVWTEQDYTKAADALSFASIELSTPLNGGGKSFISQ